MPGNQDFHVHIAKPHRQHPLRLAVIGAVLIIVVALGCADALLDAGVMTISGVPHTHFIKR